MRRAKARALEEPLLHKGSGVPILDSTVILEVADLGIERTILDHLLVGRQVYAVMTPPCRFGFRELKQRSPETLLLTPTSRSE
jgi:hypothetical protein